MDRPLSLRHQLQAIRHRGRRSERPAGTAVLRNVLIPRYGHIVVAINIAANLKKFRS